MIEEIVPPGVVAVESFADRPDVPLYPQEAAHIATAAPTRRREFATGRWCARAALARLGTPPGPIPAGASGAPQWPADVVGSITHCDGYRAAAVARAAQVLSLGIDAEPNGPLPAGVLAIVARPEEAARLPELDGGHPGTCWDRLLFCAKECLYKAWHPVTGRWLGFKDASVTFHPARRVFDAQLILSGADAGWAAPGGPLTHLSGRWVVRGGVIVTLLAVGR